MSEDIIYPAGRGVAVMPGGVVVPTGERGVTPSEVTAQIRSVAKLPYLGNDPEKQGMTLLEAAIYSMAKAAACGDLDATEKWFNRLVGKPLQTVVTAQGTLKEFLTQVAESEGAGVVDPLDD